MTGKQELRFYIEELIKGEVQYPLVGKALLSHFDMVYVLYSNIYHYMDILKKQTGKVDPNFKKEVRYLLLDQIADVLSNAKANDIKVGLERLKLRYPIEEQWTTIAKKYFLKTRTAAAILGSIIAIYKVLTREWDKRKVLANAIKTDDYLREVYEKRIYPMFENILNQIINFRVKSDQDLKRLFFRGIDSVAKESTLLAPYLQKWGYML